MEKKMEMKSKMEIKMEMHGEVRDAGGGEGDEWINVLRGWSWTAYLKWWEVQTAFAERYKKHTMIDLQGISTNWFKNPP